MACFPRDVGFPEACFKVQLLAVYPAVSCRLFTNCSLRAMSQQCNVIGPRPATQVPYDMLVVAVGSVNNTFGIKGVKEHTLSFRGIRDATALRRQVSECFERAALPHTPPQVCGRPQQNMQPCECTFMPFLGPFPPIALTPTSDSTQQPWSHCIRSGKSF